MRITHTWIEGGMEMAWAVPSRREISAYRKSDGDCLLDHCKPPRGWDFDTSEDTSEDGGPIGHYLIWRGKI
jgi:hypothetical protein